MPPRSGVCARAAAPRSAAETHRYANAPRRRRSRVTRVARHRYNHAKRQS